MQDTLKAEKVVERRKRGIVAHTPGASFIVLFGVRSHRMFSLAFQDHRLYNLPFNWGVNSSAAYHLA
jgi:hypothetical protein